MNDEMKQKLKNEVYGWRTKMSETQNTSMAENIKYKIMGALEFAYMSDIINKEEFGFMINDNMDFYLIQIDRILPKL